jgi:predicted MPP superfamily phosphohydrolase
VHRSGFNLAVFFAVITLVVGGIHYYLWSRLIRAPELGVVWQRRGAILFVGLALLTPLGMMAGMVFPKRIASIAAWAAYGWMGVSVLLLFLLLGSELVRVVIHGYNAVSSAPADPERRLAISRGIAGIVSLVALGAAGTGTVSALGQVALRNVKVPLRRLSPSMSGFRIAQLTDLHIGPTLGKGWLSDVVKHTNAANPDLIVITGDLVDGSVDELREHVQPLSGLKAPHGVWFVTGNHEYYSGVEDWYAHLPTLGVRPLRNERAQLAPGLFIAGIEDLTGSPSLSDALEGHDPSQALVLLAHQPRQFAEAARRSVPLTLSGHTHGGQIWPFSWLVALQQPFLAGLHRRGDSQLYVSRGTGFWGPPMRVFAPPEITLLRLVPA